MTMEEQQRWFSDYRKEFNYERPHEALAVQMPGTVWQPSNRHWDGRLLNNTYPGTVYKGEIEGPHMVARYGVPE